MRIGATIPQRHNYGKVDSVSIELKHHHGGVSVPNLDESIEWYGKVLDFEVEKIFDIPQIPAKVAMLRRGDLRIELFEVPQATPMSPDRRIPDRDVHTHGNKHVAFAIRDVEPVEQELRARGADIVWVGRFKHGSNIFIRDNAGNLIELVQDPEMWSG
jgi:catechol 2,3-dioxygenase-like lactoylglutathione lyase family enzyme